MAKKSKSQDVTEAELAVLTVLWDEKTATVRRIAEAMYADSAKSQHATVQKLLDRLKTKGFVARDRTVWPHLFRPAIGRDELIARQLQRTADAYCEGSVQTLMTRLLRGSVMSRDDRDSLRNLLDDMDEEE